jgi:hypothetical protein
MIGSPPLPPTLTLFVGISSTGLNHHQSTPVRAEGEPSMRLANMLGLQHYALFLNEIKYEVTGVPAQKVNVDSVSFSDFKKEFPEVIPIDITSKPAVSKTAAKAFAAAWRRKHPRYNMYTSNCQLFVRDFVYHFYGEKIVTQSLSLGWALIYVCAGLALVANVILIYILSIALNLVYAHGNF